MRNHNKMIARLECVRAQQELLLIVACSDIHKVRVQRRKETHRAPLETYLCAESLCKVYACLAALDPKLAVTWAPNMPILKIIDQVHVFQHDPLDARDRDAQWTDCCCEEHQHD